MVLFTTFSSCRTTDKQLYKTERLKLEHIQDNLGSVHVVVESYEDGLALRTFCQSFLCRYQTATSSYSINLGDTKVSNDSVFLVDMVPTSAWERLAANIEIYDLGAHLIIPSRSNRLQTRHPSLPFFAILTRIALKSSSRLTCVHSLLPATHRCGPVFNGCTSGIHACSVTRFSYRKTN